MLASKRLNVHRLGAAAHWCTGVVRGNNGTLWVFQRGSRIWNANSYDGGGNGDRITYTDAITTNALLNLDAETGRVIGGFGKDMFFMPHGLATDRQGHLWVTDTGLHQVCDAGTCIEPHAHAVCSSGMTSAALLCPERS